MANFLPQNSSPFGQMNLYTPDWSFLTTVMGTKQSEYDKGFNAVKSAYDYINTLDLTNPENQAYKDDLMNKLEGTFKSIANLDLSKGENIQKALGVMNPITEDKMLMYDVAITNKNKSEYAKAESYRNSTDPEIRKQYNKYAQLYLNYGQLELQEASRKDGSILNVKPRNFVPFGDPIGKLDKAMKDSGIKVTMSEATGGYIIETTNGPMAAQVFNDWAKMQLGDEFSEQFNIMSSVQVESAIRSQMEELGVDKRQATENVARSLEPMLIDKETKKVLAYDKEYQSLNSVLNNLQNSGQNYTASEADQIKNLIIQRDNIEKLKENSIRESTKLLQGDIDYVSGNLAHFFTEDIQDSIIDNWATSTSNATYSKTLKADEVVLTKMRIASSDSQHAARLIYDYTKLQWDNYWKSQDATAKANGTVSSSTTGIGTTSSTILGTYTSTTGEAPTGLQNMKESYDASLKGLHQNIIGSGGVIDMMQFNKHDGNEYKKVLDKLYNLTTTEGFGKYNVSPNRGLTRDEVAILNDLSFELGLGTGGNTPIISSMNANAWYDILTSGVYEKAKTDMLQVANIAGNDPEKVALLQNTLNEMTTYVNTKDDIVKTWSSLSDKIATDDTGIFAGAKVVTYDNAGNPIIDASGVNRAVQETALETFVPSYYKRPIALGDVTSYNDIPGIYLQQIVNSVGDLVSDEDDIEVEGFDLETIQSMNSVDIGKAFSNNIKASYDPNDKLVNITMQGTIGTGKSQTNGKISFSVPYTTVQNNIVLQTILGNDINKNTKDPIFTAGQFSELMQNPWAEIKGADLVSGLEYSVTGDPNISGQYGLRIDYKITDPITKEKRTDYKWISVVQGSPEAIVELNKELENLQLIYIKAEQAARAEYATGQPTYTFQEILNQIYGQ